MLQQDNEQTYTEPTETDPAEHQKRRQNQLLTKAYS